MKNGRVFWGTTFLLIGLLWFLQSTFGLTTDLEGVSRLWPLFIILLGASIVFKDKRVKTPLIGLAGVVFSLSLFSLFNGSNHWVRFYHNPYELKNEEVTMVLDSAASQVKRVYLEVEGGASSYTFRAADDKFLLVKTSGDMEVDHDINIQDTNAFGRVYMHGRNLNLDSEGLFGQFYFALNPQPIYDIEFSLGASSLDLDFSRIAISKLKFGMGVSSVKMKLGAPREDLTEVRIETGVSSVNIELPKDVEALISTEVALSSRSFEGFKSVGKGDYKTPGFDNAQKRIIIELEGALTSFNVTRY